MKKLLTLSWMALLSLTMMAQQGIALSQNRPNPFDGTTQVYLAVENAGEVTLVVTDVFGNFQTQSTQLVEAGVHRFQITIRAKGTYALGAHQNGHSASVIMLCQNGGAANRIEYAGYIGEWTEEANEELFSTEEIEEDFIGYADRRAAAPKAAAAEPFRVALSLSPLHPQPV